MSTPIPAAGRIVPAEIAHLYRVRTGVRAALALGVAASVAGNVLHAEPTLVGRAIAAWSPLALLLTVELISRVPVSSKRLAGLRMISTAVIAGIAAWVSYWHMVSVATHNGEGHTSAHLLPLSVDGLVVVASVSLVEIAARLRQASAEPADVAPPAPISEPLPEPEPIPEPEPEPETETEPEPEPETETETETESEPETEPEPEPEPKRRVPNPRRRPAVRSAAEKVTRLRTKNPDWTVRQIAEKAGVTERTARRHLNTPAAAPAAVIPAGPVTAPDITPVPEPGTPDDIAA
jgi:outer membrane biosynthesis protein TonB